MSNPQKTSNPISLKIKPQAQKKQAPIPGKTTRLATLVTHVPAYVLDFLCCFKPMPAHTVCTLGTMPLKLRHDIRLPVRNFDLVFTVRYDVLCSVALDHGWGSIWVGIALLKSFFAFRHWIVSPCLRSGSTVTVCKENCRNCMTPV